MRGLGFLKFRMSLLEGSGFWGVEGGGGRD